MAQIKIISNPYEKKISYARYDEIEDKWIDIDAINNENSKLIQDKLTSGFFPFNVKEIIDIIISEYNDEEGKIVIEFDGTRDEYNDLVSICKEDKYSDYIKIRKPVRYIENAREILPDIIKIFGDLKPIIADSIKEDEIAYDLKRFSDASSDIIPICVIGNYSSGKSTFINALIGNEILPSGENPVTAKIFKITESKDKNSASIRFKYNSEDVLIRFSADGPEVDEIVAQNELTEKIFNNISDKSYNSLSAMVNCALVTINELSPDSGFDPVGNLIEVNVPFNSTITQKITSPYMIFDTPGSNSASNIKHLEVLKEAMKGMSNGIPVFISESSKLDTTDNEDLFNIIKDIDNLDSRFTMIVVNKADLSNLPSCGYTEDDEKKILRLFIPKNLYSGGIYYVSSLMGLGSKIDRCFNNDSDTKRYRKQKEDFSDSNSEDYISLYKYNIMPEQIKQSAVRLSENCSNKILANSGFYCVECDIATFAKKYSSYDKCTQSRNFLKNILDKTTNEIERKKADAKKRREDSIELFEKYKKDLISKLNNESESLFALSKEKYAFAMEETYSACSSSFNKNELKSRLNTIEERYKEEKEYDSIKFDTSASCKALASDLIKKSGNIIGDKFSKESLKEFGEIFNGNLKAVEENSHELKETKREISELATNELIEDVIDRYESVTKNTQECINKNSIAYWKGKTSEAREILSNIVSDSKGINKEEQNKLEKIILEYPDIALFENNAQEIFNIENFRKKLIFDNTVKLKLEKLAKTYNEEMSNFVSEIKISVDKDHASGFRLWIGELLSILKENIVSYNQILQDEQLLIDKLEAEIKESEEKKSKLITGSEKIQEMMSWKEV